MTDNCKKRGTEVLTQDVFKDAPQEANVAVVNYDSTLHFGIKGSNFRFAYNAGQYRGYEKLGESVLNSKYKPEQSISKEIENSVKVITHESLERSADTDAKINMIEMCTHRIAVDDKFIPMLVVSNQIETCKAIEKDLADGKRWQDIKYDYWKKTMLNDSALYDSFDALSEDAKKFLFEKQPYASRMQNVFDELDKYFSNNT